MTEENYQNPDYDPERAAEDKARKRRNVLIVIVGALVLLNGFLGYLYFSKKQEHADTQDALISTKNLKKDLEKELKEYKASNNELKGKNAKLDSVIAEKESKIQKQASRIRDLLQKNKIKVEQYRQARQEIERLRYYTEKYQHEIDSLKRNIKQLRAENVNLENEVRETRQEKSKLKDEKAKLENQVALGSRLKLKSADISGIKIRNDGDKKETMNTNKIDQLKICFNFQENPIAKKGSRKMLIRILNSKGETVYIKSRGSGQFSFKGDTTLYTYSNKVTFNNEDQMHCTYWSKGSEFSEGVYKMELYTKGYLVGRKEFELKSGFLNLF